ncbi:MAG: hydroxypyruvate isomerase family protein [Ectothiorhodospiraceae bacterium]|nr:hydroxypyruvate isomerase family protein [Ectothiorhodospiraceae bacterium]
MPRFAANLSMLFTELPMTERFQAAARAGFAHVECQFPYDWPAEELSGALREHALQLVLHNLPAGDWRAGERGIACHPDRVAEFRQGVDVALEYSEVLGCPQLNCLAGVPPARVEVTEAWAVFEDNLAYAARLAGMRGKRILVEAINTRDVPGFLVHRSGQVLDLIRRLDLDNVLLQYDVYHMQIMEGNLAAGLESAGALLGHVQIADVPGRHQPGTGEIRFPFLFDWLDRIGYRGFIGCEYLALGSTADSFGWLQQ